MYKIERFIIGADIGLVREKHSFEVIRMIEPLMCLSTKIIELLATDIDRVKQMPFLDCLHDIDFHPIENNCFLISYFCYFNIYLDVHQLNHEYSNIYRNENYIL